MNLRRKTYLGIVEDTNDPKRLGRIRVRVQSIFEDIPLEDIPWAQPFRADKGYSVPTVGKIVNVLFYDNNIYNPLFSYSENYNINLEEVLQDYSNESYETFTALLFDHKTQIYSDEDNLTLDYKYNKITLDNESINLELKDNQQKINIGTKDANQQAMLGNNFLNWYDKFVKALQNDPAILGNGMIVTPPAPIIKPELTLSTLAKYWAKRETFISNHVDIVDNKKVKKLE
jgi:Type VI secretion system/phage-baseplate injector OB domain